MERHFVWKMLQALEPSGRVRPLIGMFLNRLSWNPIFFQGLCEELSSSSCAVAPCGLRLSLLHYFYSFENRQQRGLRKAELLSYIFRSLLSLFNCIEDLNWRRLFKAILLLSSHWLMIVSVADETSSLFYTDSLRNGTNHVFEALCLTLHASL